MKINIIGAGPVGSYTAYLLSKKGHQVNLFEEHQKVGQPVQCTGLITPSITDYIKLKKQFLLNTIQKIRLISPSNRSIIIKKKEFIIDRTQFDQYLTQLARDHGTQLYLNHHFLGQKNHHLIFKHKNKIKKIKQTITIGADGPLSKTAQAFHFPNQNQFYYGFQARIRGDFDSTTYQVTFNQKASPGFFSWLVPESQTIARIGLATNQKTNYYFKNIIKKYKGQILGYQAGLIPIYNPKIKTQHQNTYLIGDAATQVKATTGGGLIPGLEAAQHLTQAIENNQSYSQLWQSILGKNLKKHLFIRNFLNKFSNQDYNILINTINQKNLQKLNREHLNFWELTKIIIQTPQLARFIKHLF